MMMMGSMTMMGRAARRRWWGHSASSCRPLLRLLAPRQPLGRPSLAPHPSFALAVCLTPLPLPCPSPSAPESPSRLLSPSRPPLAVTSPPRCPSIEADITEGNDNEWPRGSTCPNEAQGAAEGK
ncbi:unnamed protein product [Cyclocybe aegerita]|uniref:Uncharacterized protein n=1 Tax=Cyclocybe aegerita TaxID=1973307 RepID=A0A8S0WKH0_CYCAE|nr:unnamed protein product [Cyclocybe aegerita]